MYVCNYLFGCIFKYVYVVETYTTHTTHTHILHICSMCILNVCRMCMCKYVNKKFISLSVGFTAQDCK